MSTTQNRWLDQVIQANSEFKGRIRPEKLPVQRTPFPVAVITCMDPRVNLEAIGIPSFTGDGEGRSAVRVIRTIGAMSDHRSLVIGIFLAGFTEIALVMHTDCGCCLAFSKIDTIIDNMQRSLNAAQFQTFRASLGEPFRENLIAWLKAFEDPRVAVKREIQFIRSQLFVPRNLIVHGLLYELATGNIEIVANGYDEANS